MSELKTLKDIDEMISGEGLVEDYKLYRKEIRAEAINQYKSLLLAIDNPPRDKITDIVAWNYSLAFLRNWIKHFFNLTEEDLK